MSASPPASPAAVLVVNADDYGLTAGVCRGILRTAAEGVVTATSVLSVGAAASEWAAALRDSGLGVGCHLALVGEDPPLLAARDIPTLVDRRGRLASSWRALAPRVLAGRVDPDDVERECNAQIDRLAEWGLRPDHLDTHQHVHLLPQLGAVVARLAAERGGLGVRIPCVRGRSPRGLALRAASRRLAAVVDAEPGVTGYPSWGIEGAGRLDAAMLVGRIEALRGSAPGVYEISAHPGGTDDPDRRRYGWGYDWEREADALCSAAVRRAVAESGLTPGTVGRPS